MSKKHARLFTAFVFMTMLPAIASFLFGYWVGTLDNGTEVETVAQAPVTDPQPIVEETELLDPFESENIQQALIEQEYIRDDIPMDLDDQASLRAACEESGVPFELALAVVWKETTFRNVNGDNGDSIGYMQVQPKWHRARMDKLGVDDLTVPINNFRVGCDFLAELMGKYTLEEALTAYNSGRPGQSAYADSVIAYMEEITK